MTKFILHGGEISRKTTDNKKFFSEMTAGFEHPVKVLCVYFSRSTDEWDRLFQQDQESFSEAAPARQIEFERAEKEPKIFNRQVKEADVIYMRGGTTKMLLDTLKTIENFSDLIKDKVVSGSSAGACVLSKYYCTGSHDAPISEGLGILDIKTIVHYDPSNEKLLQDMKEHGDKELEIYKIEEEKFFIIEE